MDFTLFKTKLGWCGIAWSVKGLTRLHLPEPSIWIVKKKNPDINIMRVENFPPAWLSRLITRVQKHLGGNPQDFSDISIDFNNISDFRCRVYAATRRIRSGQIKTYGEVAKEIGSPGAARAVGHALSCNPIGLVIPCHRVVAVNHIGGFSAFGGEKTKLKLLSIEGYCGYC